MPVTSAVTEHPTEGQQKEQGQEQQMPAAD